MTGLDDNRELDDFLARRSVLHRRLADRDSHEPSQELDRLVLNKAREAIEVQSSSPIYRAPRWALPAALAASVVLALAVVVNFARMHGGGGYRIAATSSPAPQSLGPESRTDSTNAGTDNATFERAQTSQLASSTAAATSAPPSRTHADVQMPAEVHAASDASKVTGALPGNAKLASAGTEPAANSPRFARAETPSTRRILPAREAALREAAGSAPAAAPVLTDPVNHRDPQVWMRDIEQLRLAGKSADADREITAFRKAFPTLPVSPAALGRDPRPTK